MSAIGIDLFFGEALSTSNNKPTRDGWSTAESSSSHPDWFAETAQFLTTVSGEIFYDEAGRWIGTVLSSFGICYNSDSLRRLEIERDPVRAGPTLAIHVSSNRLPSPIPPRADRQRKAFEMIIQQQIQEAIRSAKGPEETCLQIGWALGLQIIQRASANARYFTDAASSSAGRCFSRRCSYRHVHRLLRALPEARRSA